MEDVSLKGDGVLDFGERIFVKFGKEMKQHMAAFTVFGQVCGDSVMRVQGRFDAKGVAYDGSSFELSQTHGLPYPLIEIQMPFSEALD